LVKEATCAAVLKALRTRRKPANQNHIIFYLMRNFFNQDQKTNSQNNRYHCSDPKDVPIVVHTQEWQKAKPDEPPVEGNVASQLTRLLLSRLFHVERI
jgi:hypothetical protein